MKICKGSIMCQYLPTESFVKIEVIEINEQKLLKSILDKKITINTDVS